MSRPILYRETLPLEGEDHVYTGDAVLRIAPATLARWLLEPEVEQVHISFQDIDGGDKYECLIELLGAERRR